MSDTFENPASAVTEDPVAAAIKGIDIATISKDDVFTDVIHNSKLFAFRLMVAASLLEQLIIRDRNAAAPETAPEPAQES